MDSRCRHLIIFFVLLALITACAAPLAAPQATTHVYRIGYLGGGADPRPVPNGVAFVEELARLGYVVDQNLTIEYRWADGKLERLAELARELATLKLDAVFAGSEPPAQALLEADIGVPIVMVTWDAVAAGLVASTLNRPDRNITGVTGCSALLGPKRLQLLKEAIPGAKTVAVLWNPLEPVNVVEWEAMQAASATVGVKLLSVPVRQPDELEAAFAIARQGSDAMCVTGGAFESNNSARITQLAAQHRLPAVYGFRALAADGGLMSYGTNAPDMYRRAAHYMDKILKGARPSDLPIEQPTSFDLVVNAKTAADLGITLPESLNVRVTEVIR